MNKQYKVLSAFKAGEQALESGMIVELDEDSATKYLELGLVAEHDEAAEKAKTDHLVEIKSVVADEVSKGIKAGVDEVKKAAHIEVLSDEVDNKAAGFKSIGEQLGAIREHAASNGAYMDERLDAVVKAATGLNEGIDSEGGFLVREDFAAQLESEAQTTGVIAGKASSTEISANSNRLVWNAVDDSNRTAGNRRGGITTYWTDEAGTKTASTPKYERRAMDLEKLIGLYYSTDELLQDATALASEVGSWFAEEFGFAIDDAMLRGTGAGQPAGVIGNAATVSVAKETSQTATTIVGENVEKMWMAMRPASMARAEWYINQDCWQQLFAMQKTTGTGGLPVFMPPAGLSATPYGTLLGKPINVLEQCATLGSVGDIIFADFSEYKMIRKGGVQSASSIHVKFVNDETAFRFVMRINGQPKARTTTTPAQGSNATSAFVTLAVRA